MKKFKEASASASSIARKSRSQDQKGPRSSCQGLRSGKRIHVAAYQGERRYFFEFFTALRRGTSGSPVRTGCAFSTGESSLLKIIRRSNDWTVLMNGSGTYGG